ncbi:DUF6199 family natural product biosynthesis protein [Paenibacillus sp. 2TAB26]|uniref:DUF6199 family natural product biosynthesis protein n=1 Tax=Paenibacillus sp. 2TAB26 TaxID=3233005 RepID=UPI003F997628
MYNKRNTDQLFLTFLIPSFNREYTNKGLILVVLFVILFVIIAFLNIFFPKFGWYMRYGWMVKGNSEPSDAYILMSRISSIIILIVFLFVILPNLF